MLLKKFQTTVLETVSLFAKTLASESDDRAKLAAVLTAQGIKVPPDTVGKAAWDELRSKGKLPSSSPDWIERRDPLGREIFSACLKVPTGGGKTLLGAHSIGRVHESLYGRRHGLVVWFVPSEAIYAQTLRAFTKHGHHYRGALENAANGKLKILDKRSQISRTDIDSNLCVLVVMLQATVREKSDVLKIFRDSGAFQGFFPSVEDQAANAALKAQVSNLDVLDAAGELGIPGISIRHSLANVLRCVRPMFVIDEGHRAYTDLARDALQDLNPSFILELTATPNIGDHHSNALTSVSGVDLKTAELIKLPINIEALIDGSWQRVVQTAMATRAKLEKVATADARKTGRKIRPIALIRAESTGTRKPGAPGSSKVHVDDVKKFLITKLQIPEAWIRLKTADVNELGDEDLLDDACEVRVILTKDALREGWDCPFAYVLAVLNARTSKLAITQMAGRVLRQPYARLAADRHLNEAHVVCLTDDIRLAVDAVCAGLQQEGMADAEAWVRVQGGVAASRVTIARSKLLQGNFLLPLVAIRSGTSWVEFHPERHLLSRLDWKSLAVPDLSTFAPTMSRESVSTSVGLRSVNGNLTFEQSSPLDHTAPPTSDAYVPAVEILRAVVPNAWIAFDLIRTAEMQRASNGISVEQQLEARVQLAKFLALKFAPIVDKLLESEFLKLCQAGTIKLLASVKPEFGVCIPQAMDAIQVPGDSPIMRANGQPLAKNVFVETPRSEANPLEQAALRAIDAAAGTQWWWRVPVKGDWGLRGWRRESIYPDFVVCAHLNGQECIVAIETKGAHLVGNDDTTYKKAVLAALQSAYLADKVGAKGDGKLAPPDVAQSFIGLMLEETSWQTALAAVLPPPQLAASSKGPAQDSAGKLQRRSGPAQRRS